MKIIESELESSESNEKDNTQESEVYIRDFLVRYKQLLMCKWSNVDEEVYKGFKFTIDKEGPLILAPTGRGCEYAIIGRNSKDLYTSLSTLPIVGSDVYRLGYIDDNIVNPILDVCFSGCPQHPDVIDSRLSAAALDRMYGKKPVFDKGDLVGYCFQYIAGKPSVQSYIDASLETFLANPKNYIDKIKPISNELDEPTFRYIDLNIPQGDWSAYLNWFQTSFEDYKMQGRVFMNQIGALLDAKNTSKQSAWIRGFGDDGKTSVMNAIGAYMGQSYSPIDPTLFETSFGMTQFDNIRMGIISDSKDPHHIGKHWFHQITGGDDYKSNEKMKAATNKRAISRVFFLENIDPIVNINEDNQLSRIIYYRCKRKTNEEKIAAGIGIYDEEGTYQNIGNAEWPKLLEAQCEAFLAACIREYFGPNSLCPSRSQIMVPNIMKESLISSCSHESDDAVETVLYSLYEQGTNEDFVLRSDLHDGIRNILDKKWNALKTPITIRLLIEKEFRGRVVQNKVDGIKHRVYTNIRRKKTYTEPKAEVANHTTPLDPFE